LLNYYDDFVMINDHHHQMIYYLMFLNVSFLLHKDIHDLQMKKILFHKNETFGFFIILYE